MKSIFIQDGFLYYPECNGEISEISKLTERISKDPHSKLFVPLAEEYKKAGDLEMSIHVLNEGLKNNPGYVTARSFLGKLLIEKGDLPGAQKEFEEVVKAIPENLMAQRKLSDLYALQDRRNDSLEHYKIALSLNPRDQDVASLVSDIEAGHDVKPRLQKKIPVGEPTPKQAELQPAKAEASGPANPEKKAVSAAAAAAPEAKMEEAEEILVVEPLETSVPLSMEQELSAHNLDFLAETGHESGFPSQEQQKVEELFDLSQPFEQAQHLNEEVGEIEVTVPAPARTEADDFTTDTLAELYISQGFFEKAVEIYERMLADNPDSQGLKDKLASVRAMAAESGGQAETREKPAAFSLPGEFAAEDGIADIAQAGDFSSGLDDDFQGEPAAETGTERLEDWNEPVPSEQSLSKPESEFAGTESAKPKPFDASFEPVEYVPPDAVPQKQAAQGGKKTQPITDESNTDLSDRQAHVKERTHSPGGRKETIDRLENWLQNIMKEK